MYRKPYNTIHLSRADVQAQVYEIRGLRLLMILHYTCIIQRAGGGRVVWWVDGVSTLVWDVSWPHDTANLFHRLEVW